MQWFNGTLKWGITSEERPGMDVAGHVHGGFVLRLHTTDPEGRRISSAATSH